MDSFREWLSDNLRYICLILGILIILIGVFFGVRTLTRVISSGNGSQQVQEDSIVAGSAVTASAGNSTAVQTPSSAGSTAVATPTQPVSESRPADVTATPTATPEVTQVPVDENAEQEVSDVINTYYAALNTKSIDAIRTVTERLSEFRMRYQRFKQKIINQIQANPGRTAMRILRSPMYRIITLIRRSSWRTRDFRGSI